MKHLNAIIAYHMIEKAKELLNEPAQAGSRAAHGSSRRELSKYQERIMLEEASKAVDALNSLNYYEGNLRKQQIVANAIWDAYERLAPNDRGQARRE